jgi:hypothetical protein
MTERSSRPSANSKLMMFGKKPTQMAIQKTNTIRIHPKNPVDSFPLIFEIDQSEGFIDWDKTQLRLKFQLCNLNGTPIDETKAGKVTTVNYLGNTFFNRLRFFASNTLLYDSFETYAYKAYLEAVLMEPEEVKKTLLVSALYYEDTAGKADSNEGFKERYGITKGGTFSTLAPLHGDIFTCQQYFPRMTDYRLELFRNSDNFLLIASKESNEEYGLVLTKAELLLNVIYPLPSFALAYERMMIKTPAQFNIKILHLSANLVDMPNTCIHTGVIPRRVIMMMIPSVDFFGKLTSNPFNFKSFTLERYQLKANDKLYPPDPQTMDFAGGDAVEMYRQLFDGLAGSSQMCSLTYAQFLNGYTFIVTDLSPDASGGAGKRSNSF